MDLHDAIAGRRSIRDYSAQAVDDQSLRRLIDAAVQAPSAMNQQPWHFTVVRDQRLLDRISREAKAHMLATMPATPGSDHFRSMLGDEKFHIFYHAPALIIVAATDAGTWGAEDCALAAQNLMLAAYAHGLGSCWIGFAQSYLNTPQGKQLVGLAPASVVVAPIIVGHAKAAVAAVPRKEPRIEWLGR